MPRRATSRRWQPDLTAATTRPDRLPPSANEADVEGRRAPSFPGVSFVQNCAPKPEQPLPTGLGEPIPAAGLAGPSPTDEPPMPGKTSTRVNRSDSSVPPLLVSRAQERATSLYVAVHDQILAPYHASTDPTARAEAAGNSARVASDPSSPTDVELGARPASRPSSAEPARPQLDQPDDDDGGPGGPAAAESQRSYQSSGTAALPYPSTPVIGLVGLNSSTHPTLPNPYVSSGPSANDIASEPGLPVATDAFSPLTSFTNDQLAQWLSPTLPQHSDNLPHSPFFDPSFYPPHDYPFPCPAPYLSAPLLLRSHSSDDGPHSPESGASADDPQTPPPLLHSAVRHPVYPLYPSDGFEEPLVALATDRVRPTPPDMRATDISTVFRAYSSFRTPLAADPFDSRYQDDQPSSVLRHAREYAYESLSEAGPAMKVAEEDEVEALRPTITPERVRSSSQGALLSLRGFTSMDSVATECSDLSTAPTEGESGVSADLSAKGAGEALLTSRATDLRPTRVTRQDDARAQLNSMPWWSGDHRLVPARLVEPDDSLPAELVEMAAMGEAYKRRATEDKDDAYESGSSDDDREDRASSYQPSEEAYPARKRRRGRAEAVSTPIRETSIPKTQTGSSLRDAAREGERKSKGRTSLFLIKLNQMLQDPSARRWIQWSTNGEAIVIKDVDAFSTEVLPRYVETNNFDSFARQLHTYKFSRRTEGRTLPRRCSLRHPAYNRSNFSRIVREIEEAQAANIQLAKKTRGRQVNKDRISELENRLAAAHVEIEKLRAAQEERALICGTGTPMSSSSAREAGPSAPPPPFLVESINMERLVAQMPESPTPSASIARSQYPSMMAGPARTSDEATLPDTASSALCVPGPEIDTQLESKPEVKSAIVRGAAAKGRGRRGGLRGSRSPKKTHSTLPKDRK